MGGRRARTADGLRRFALPRERDLTCVGPGPTTWCQNQARRLSPRASAPHSRGSAARRNAAFADPRSTPARAGRQNLARQPRRAAGRGDPAGAGTADSEAADPAPCAARGHSCAVRGAQRGSSRGRGSPVSGAPPRGALCRVGGGRTGALPNPCAFAERRANGLRATGRGPTFIVL